MCQAASSQVVSSRHRTRPLWRRRRLGDICRYDINESHQKRTGPTVNVRVRYWHRQRNWTSRGMLGRSICREPPYGTSKGAWAATMVTLHH